MDIVLIQTGADEAWGTEQYLVKGAGMDRESTLFLTEKGAIAASSAKQVEKIIRIGKEHRLEPASPKEAREKLKLKGLEKVRY